MTHRDREMILGGRLWLIGLVFFTSGLLSACSLFDGAREPMPRAPSELTFLQELSRQYDVLAADEAAEYDWRDSRWFRARAERARYGEFVEPEAIAARDLAVIDIRALTAARSALIAALERGAPLFAGAIAARAQAGFDCWIQEQEEGHQPDHIATCRAGFDMAMAELRDLGPRLAVVLLPDVTGKVGAVDLANEVGAQRLDQAGASGVMTRNALPTSAGTLDTATIQQFFGAALAAQPPPPVSFILYFIAGTDQPTAESEAQLPEILATVRARTAPDVTVIGHSDRQGAAAANYRLALQRAEKVAGLIYGLGVARNLVEVRSFGETDPLVPTADDVPEARNRRVETTIR